MLNCFEYLLIIKKKWFNTFTINKWDFKLLEKKEIGKYLYVYAIELSCLNYKCLLNQASTALWLNWLKRLFSKQEIGSSNLPGACSIFFIFFLVLVPSMIIPVSYSRLPIRAYS